MGPRRCPGRRRRRAAGARRRLHRDHRRAPDRRPQAAGAVPLPPDQVATGTSSWLVKGAYILGAFAAVVALWWPAAASLDAGTRPLPGRWRRPRSAAAGPPATPPSCSVSARAATCGRRRCCCRSCWPRRSPPAARRSPSLDLFMDIPEAPGDPLGFLAGDRSPLALLIAIELWSRGSATSSWRPSR